MDLDVVVGTVTLPERIPHKLFASFVHLRLIIYYWWSYRVQALYISTFGIRTA